MCIRDRPNTKINSLSLYSILFQRRTVYAEKHPKYIQRMWVVLESVNGLHSSFTFLFRRFLCYTRCHNSLLPIIKSNEGRWDSSFYARRLKFRKEGSYCDVHGLKRIKEKRSASQTKLLFVFNRMYVFCNLHRIWLCTYIMHRWYYYAQTTEHCASLHL